MIHSNQLAPFTIIKVKKHICNQVGQQTKKVVLILEVEIMTPGDQVGAKLGSPVQIGSDGKIPDGPANQNSNPNAGAAKRAGGPGGLQVVVVDYNSIFSQGTFRTFNFKMRAKADTYNDETRVKHTVTEVVSLGH